MHKLKNIDIDLLLRIDFFALTQYGEIANYSDSAFEADKRALKSKYNITKTYKRTNGSYEYVRLYDVMNHAVAYENYLRDLHAIHRLWCCQLEQAIGLFHNKELTIFFSTDSDFCYDTKSHLAAIEETFTMKSAEDWANRAAYTVNTFFGYRNADKLIIAYCAASINIDSADENHEKYEIEFEEFSAAIKTLKKCIIAFYQTIKQSVTDLPKAAAAEDMAHVFNEHITTV